MSIYFRSPTNHRNVLQLQLFPAQGVAVAATYEEAGDELAAASPTRSRSRRRRSTAPWI